MRKSLIQFLLMAVLSAYTAVAWSQTTVRGQLVDAETGEPLVGAAVMVEGTTQGSDRKSTRLNSSHSRKSRMPSSA